MKTSKVVEIDFAELSDGSIVEMIEDPADATKTLLAVYSNKSVRYTKSVDDRGTTFVPLPRASNNLEHVCLAAGVEDYGQILDLLSDIAEILRACLDLGPRSLELVNAFAISTWFHERLNVAPYLALVGPPGSGKTTAMRILNSLCYRGLLTADISSSAMYDISHRIHPTVLLDETLTAGRPRELIHLLKATSTPGFVFLKKDKARLAFGPKVFSWLELPDDQALNSRCIIIPMQKTSRTDLKRPNDPRVSECTKTMRMRLLQFRFERFRNVSEPKPPFYDCLSGRSLDLYQALTLSIEEHEPFCKFLAGAMVFQDRLQARPLSPAQVSTLWALYQFIHQSNSVFWSLRELTAMVNNDLKRRGEPSGFNERKLGGVLTSLSLTNRYRTNIGYVQLLERAERVRIHKAARAYDIELALSPFINQSKIDKCEICKEVDSPVPASPPPKTAAVETQTTKNETATGVPRSNSKIKSGEKEPSRFDRRRRERRERQARSLRSRAGEESD